MSVDQITTPDMAGPSLAWQAVLHGRSRDLLLPDCDAVTFAEDEVLYDLGDTERNLFFIVHGAVKTGTITDSGREIIYDIRKDGDVLGELCAMESARSERAVALEPTQAVSAPIDEVLTVLPGHPALLSDLLRVFCSALAEAHDQVNRLGAANVERGLIRVLKTLARKHGRASGPFVEITVYLTQEELSQMVVARRERVSTSLNLLRRRGILRYSPRGHLLLDLSALEAVDLE